MDRGSWQATVHGSSQGVGHDLACRQRGRCCFRLTEVKEKGSQEDTDIKYANKPDKFKE